MKKRKEPAGDLRQRMIEEMQLRRYSERTQESYVAAVGRLAGWSWKSPGAVDDEELRGYFLHLRNQKRLARATTTIALCAIKFFFETVLKRDWTAMDIPRPRAEHKLPVVLSREEVWRILGAVRELRHRACLTLIYTCGLRLGEGCRLQVGDVRRFLPHELPSGFVKVRHYGLHHPSRKRTLVWVRAMLCLLRGVPIPAAPEPEDPLPPPRCPRCDIPMERRERTWRPIPSAGQSPMAHARGPPAAS